MADIQEAIKMLQCAEMNCDNAHKLSSVGVMLVKSQIQDAIKALGGEIVSEDVLAPYREQEAQDGK